MYQGLALLKDADWHLENGRWRWLVIAGFMIAVAIFADAIG